MRQRLRLLLEQGGSALLASAGRALRRSLRPSPRGASADAVRRGFEEILLRSPTPQELEHYVQLGSSLDDLRVALRTRADYASRLQRDWNQRGWRFVCAQSLAPASEAVRSGLGVSPGSWAGDLNVVAPGKAGEVLFLTGALPALRRQLPKATITLHTLAPYVPVALGASARFDEVRPLEVPGGPDLLAQRVSAAVYDHAYPGYGVFRDQLWVSAFRAHPWSPVRPSGVKPGPFFFSFCDALGCSRDQYVLPGWAASPDGAPLALAFPTTNIHSSRRGRLPFSPRQWEELAARARVKGLEPVATGRPEDGDLELPGWEWRDAGIEEVLSLLGRSAFVLGGNSGITFAACALSPGRVLMLDEIGSAAPDLLYDFTGMHRFFDLSRCLQLRLCPEGRLDDFAFEVAHDLLTSSGVSKPRSSSREDSGRAAPPSA